MTETDALILLVSLAALVFFFVAVWSMVQPRARPPREIRPTRAPLRDRDRESPLANAVGEAVGDVLAHAAGRVAARPNVATGGEHSGYSGVTFDEGTTHAHSVSQVERDDPSVGTAIAADTSDRDSVDDRGSDHADSGSFWDLDLD